MPPLARHDHENNSVHHVLLATVRKKNMEVLLATELICFQPVHKETARELKNNVTLSSDCKRHCLYNELPKRLLPMKVSDNGCDTLQATVIISSF